ncbi:MAG: PilZ domain-containing protein [Magnetococcales bacterium]|nr:PilZ domain-containing protein [Magnetococcales bacterium]
MADQPQSKHNNPIFVRYGSLIEQCFQPNLPVGSKIAIFPSVVVGLKSGDEGSRPTKQIEAYANPADIEYLQNAVDKLRASIQNETKGYTNEEDDATSKVTGPITRKLAAFRTGLANRNEAMLEDNPFYELTVAAYRINIQTLKSAFTHGIKNTLDRAPQPIKVARSYYKIWTSDKTITSTSQKITESLGKVLSLGKLLLGIALFLGSTSTTAKGVIDLLQLPTVESLLGGMFSGPEHETARLALSLTIGFLLSSVILDFKNRLFIGVAETGQVIKGFIHGFKLNPRWVVVACFLTMISIWTNYDGIVLMMSKGTDLAVQLETIKAQSLNALGDPTRTNLDKPNSLWDLKALMEKKSAEAIKKFNKVPDDEMSGTASSGIAKQGPRYWGKQFIIQGNYIPGKQDVATSYSSSAMSTKIDYMLKSSGLDLTTSLEAKIQAILKKYTDNLAKTQLTVTENLTALEEMMTFKSYTPQEFLTIYSLESYHVNKGVMKVVGALEASKEAFGASAREINQLAAAYIQLLREVDKIGTPANNAYEIDVRFDIPPLDAIDQLKNGKIPEAQRRNLAELKNILMERNGVALGSAILILILFVSISMDLSDPIFYSRMIARWGVRDRHFLDENMYRFRKWEEDHLLRLKAFLVRPDIRPILPSLPNPSLNVLHHDFHLFLENLDSRVKDSSDHGLFETLRFWFVGLFKETRIGQVHGYNARQTAIMKYLQNPETYNPRLLDTIFPGVLDKFQLGKDHFDTLFDRIKQGLDKNNQFFNDEINFYKQIAETQSEQASQQQNSADAAKDTLKKATGLIEMLHFIRSWLNRLFLAALSGPHVPFPLSRINWLKEQVRSQAQSRAQINFLSDFTPSLNRLLIRMTTIQNTTIKPLYETMHRIPNWYAIEQALAIDTLDKEFKQIQQGLFTILGLSNFQGFQVPEEMIRTIIEKTNIQEIIQVYLHRNKPVEILDQRIDQLETRLLRAYHLVKNLVEEQSTLIFSLTKIRRDHLTPISVALSPLQNRPMIERSLDIDKMRHELLAIEQCLLDLWNTSPAEPGLFGSLPEERRVIDMESIVAMIKENEKHGEFKLHTHVKQLETRMQAASKKLNESIHKIMMIDRMTIKIRSMADEIPGLLTQITERDAQTQDFQLFDQTIDQRKINFLDDNRLFFKTVPLQVDAILVRVDALLSDPNMTEAHNITLLRSLENQTFKLRYFLKNAMDYLDGKRSGIGLSASLAQLTTPATTVQPSTTTDLPISQEVLPDQPLAQWTHAIRQMCATTRQTLLSICLKEWDQLKQSIPHQEILQTIQQQQNSVNQIAQNRENALSTLDALILEVGTAPPTTKQLDSLRALRDQVEGFTQLIGQIDKQIDEAMPVAQASSRRTIERTVIHSPIELTIGTRRITGHSQDLSPRGICLEIPDAMPRGLTPGQDGTFRLISDPTKTQFPCKCIRITGSCIILTLLSGHEANFVTRIREEIVRDRGEKTGILDSKLPNPDGNER